ncbi:hypothetical protein PanWU01x14_149060 [Parasponia andersonii]|uniref:Uncharacterized protein n=1 Tax=Parasponia andersonii TaxID=3476 RepID=A0A2P5CIS3_PARAD|nr:hypothetical protein PanWU01x14_149060 [Parasponia andersonii]
MLGVAPVEGSGRRLPQWMLGGSVADQVGKSDKTEVKKKPLENGVSRTCHSDQRTKAINPGKESLLHEEEKSLESSHVLAKCKTRRRKVKEKQVDADSDTNISEDVQAKKYSRTRRKTSESASRKRRKRKESGLASNEEPLSEGDDVDLTVEDLMTIAEEYVKANKNMEQEQVAKGEHDSRSRPRTTLFYRNESKDCNQSLATDDIGASYSQTSAIHDVSSSYISSNSSTEEAVINARGTGDPAQDMLNLFLGPLLKKPVEEKKKDFVIEDLAFSEEFGKFGVENKKNIAKVVVPSMKKKSSLKDKVAMFLD